LLVDQAGKKDIGHLRKGKATLDEYYGKFKSVHGDRVAISPAVQQKAAEIEAMLRKAEDDAKNAPPPGPDPKADPDGDPRPGPDDDPDPKPVVLNAQNNGNGLIIAGSVVVALGIGAIVMIPVGSSRGKDATERFNSATQALEGDPNNPTLINQRDKAEFDGKQADSILIAGAVLAPLLLAGGVVMLVFGIRAKQKYNSQQAQTVLTPVVGRGFGGFQLRGRF
jgi:hypothetical protein